MGRVLFARPRSGPPFVSFPGAPPVHGAFPLLPWTTDAGAGGPGFHFGPSSAHTALRLWAPRRYAGNAWSDGPVRAYAAGLGGAPNIRLERTRAQAGLFRPSGPRF